MNDITTPDFKIQLNESKELSAKYLEQGLSIDGENVQVEMIKIKNNLFQIIYEKRAFEILMIEKKANNYLLQVNGKEVRLSVKDKISQTLESLGMDFIAEEVIEKITAPMPGSILKIMTQVGNAVEEGDSLLILEAMKMENVIKSPRSGIVQSINTEEGLSVEKGALLISFE